MVKTIFEAITIIGKIILTIFGRKAAKESKNQKIIDEISDAFKKRDGSGIARGLNRWWRLRR